MADFTIKDPPEYDPLLRMLEPTDPNHADVFNALFGQLINNDVFLVALAQKTAEALLEHCDDGVIHVTAQQKQSWDAKAGTAEATAAKAGLMAAADKTKLDGVAAGAEVNQNAYGSIKVGNVTVTANGKTATFTLEAGSNITLSADNAAKKIIITADRDGGNADTVDGYHAVSLAKASEVEDLKKSVSDGKTAVAGAVTAKGVTTVASATFATIAANIGKISTGVDTSDATATDGEVLSGKTFYAKGAKITGKMTNHGAVTQALNAGGSYTIPAGYHNGNGKVTVNSLASQTSANAAAADIMSGKTAWVNGSKITGVLTAQSIGLTADKLVEGNTVLGVKGTAVTGSGKHLITRWSQGVFSRKDFPVYIDVSSNNPGGSLQLSDILTKYTDFNILKIVTKYMYKPTNSSETRTYYDYLILLRDTYPGGATDVSAFGNRSASTTNLKVTLTNYFGQNVDILNAAQYLKDLSSARYSADSLDIIDDGYKINKIRITVNSANLTDIECDIFII